MTLTTEPKLGTEQPSPAPIKPSSRRWRPILGWIAVVAALTTTAGLVIAVLTPDSARTDRNLHFDVGDAKDHPGYGPISPAAPDRNLHLDVGDAKDHPGYRRATLGPAGEPTAPDRTTQNALVMRELLGIDVPILHFDIGDAKDHPRYNP